MFSKAYEIARQYTHPVIVSKRFFDKSVESGLGSFIILNEDGWIVTAAHIIDIAFTHKQHVQEIKSYYDQFKAIMDDKKLNPYLKEKHLNKLKPNNKWITNFSFWWGHGTFRIDNFKILRENDLAIGKIENYDKKFQQIYPALKKPENLKNGTSLCKLGYPFYKVQTDFDEKNDSFKLDPNVFPIPIFPIDGIFTRHIFAGKSHDDKFDIKFLETSTPGLKGQSGGPTFDINGNIWTIQSQTKHLELGFSPKVKKDKKEVEENQFLNVGWGVHVDTLIKFLNEKKVSFNISDE